MITRSAKDPGSSAELVTVMISTLPLSVSMVTQVDLVGLSTGMGHETRCQSQRLRPAMNHHKNP